MLSVSALIMSVALLLVSMPFFVLAWILSRTTQRLLSVSLMIFFPASILLTFAMLIVIDNFTLTLFGWGVRSTSGLTIYLYRLLTVALAILASWLLYGFLNGRYSAMSLKGLTVVTVLIFTGSIPLFFSAIMNPVEKVADVSGSDQFLPNILIFSGDGISATHMSIYGYERPTTPFLKSVKDEFLIAENHFTNAKDTGGSVVSLLTGKLPTTTRVIYPPDVLRGIDSYEHMPGLLKKLGYYTADISMRHYADPYDLNLRGGFAEANFRKLKVTGGTLVSTIREIPALNPASLLIDRISERISERFDHIWKNKKMQDPMAAVNAPDLRWIRDPIRMEEIRSFIDTAQQPFFLNVHMMGTHGERFRPTKRIYSTEEDYPTLWSVDGYDDAIIDFDRRVGEIYDFLKQRNILESTILIVSSDHGFIHSALDRLPMILRLPDQEKAGVIGGNTQRLDIAPTLLDAIGIQQPDWMEGNTMLDSKYNQAGSEFIFSSGSRSEKSADGAFWSTSLPVAPWFSLGEQFLIHCDQGFTLKLEGMEISEGKIDGSTMDCKNRMSAEDARRILLSHLEKKGYAWK